LFLEPPYYISLLFINQSYLESNGFYIQKGFEKATNLFQPVLVFFLFKKIFKFLVKKK